MSRMIFWNDNEIIKESIYRLDECKYKVNNICFYNHSRKYGKKCHGCKLYTEEDNKVEPYDN